MRFVIVTGMSGAGKSTALKMLEDMEYFCVDNLPVPLLDKFAQLVRDGGSGDINKVALGVDIRSGMAFGELEQALERLRVPGFEPEGAEHGDYPLYGDGDAQCLRPLYPAAEQAVPGGAADPQDERHGGRGVGRGVVTAAQAGRIGERL